MIIPFIQPIEQGSARREAVQGEGEREEIILWVNWLTILVQRIGLHRHQDVFVQQSPIFAHTLDYLQLKPTTISKAVTPTKAETTRDYFN
jgi:hypothetical protein